MYLSSLIGSETRAGDGPGVMAGAQLLHRAEIIPGVDPEHYA